MDGSLPSELGRLTALKSLRLENNKFHGALPSELAKLEALSTYYLRESLLEEAQSQLIFSVYPPGLVR